MPVYWYREKNPQPSNRPPAWYLQDTVTEHTHMRVVWLDDGLAGPGWHYVIIGPSHVPRKYSPFAYDIIILAKAAAREWWKINHVEHLQQFKD